MEAIGFGETLTLLIGWGEAIGVAGLITGIFIPQVKSIAVLWLWPFAISALAVHFSYHHPFSAYLNALLVSILPIVLLATDKHFGIVIQ